MIRKWKCFHEYYSMGTQKLDFIIKNKKTCETECFCCHILLQCLAYTVHIDRSVSHAIHKHSCRSQHISVLTTCTFMFQQVCTIEPSFFKMTYASGMHRPPFEGRHLVIYKIVFFCFDIIYFIVNIRASKSLPILSLPH